ncbi:nuclear protein localization protein 4 [Paragonimus westermani]|uniref:Nuclear protein localization protein 4 n=1 Tax=Paragonimus westermani TaxID=34504 RepID=A0A5J4N6U7_9TREM|nr:nuclear protein localization protein 4 [Paragonimus westermani]
MIVRVQSPWGTKKFDVSESDKYEKLVELIASEFKIGSTCTWCLATSRDGSGRISCSSSTRLAKLGLKHGDMIFLLDKPQSAFRSAPGDGEAYVEDHHVVDVRPKNPFGSSVNVVEDDIDQELAKMDGQIKRKRNEQLCHHPPLGKCIHCAPLEPYDEAYLEHLDPPVKFMSFHAYLRKLSGGHGKGKFVTLENLSCRVRSGCHDHSPWPDGICTKCQPNPITLEIQSYRHVDYVQIENGQLMEIFLDFWRQTGRQRIGLMLGRYAHHDIVGSPSLSIKAVVSAIYEPQQVSLS